jgi:serine/threonine protein kinase
MSESSRGPLVGRTISHYRVVAQLGAGGMGVVYRGEDVRLGRPVAIKVVADDFANDSQAVARLRAEARAASALNHPNISTIYDIGTDDGRPFIVMELMEGQTLRERLGRGHLKVHELVDVGIQIADALQAAHAAGIMHRDIKPANIFLTGRGHVKLLDFGLAKLAATQPNADSVTLGTADLTMPGTTFGTVAYMSPEQAAGDDLDGRSDIFSLGVVLYECATGQRPFDGKTHAVILSEILNRTPTAPSAINQELPARLQEIILACLEKDRELRYQSAADLRADLKRVRRDLESGRIHTGATTEISGNRSVQTTRVSAAAHTQAKASVQAAGCARPSEASAPPRSWVPLAIGAVLVIAAAGAGTMYIVSSRQAGTTTTATGSGNAMPRSRTADPTTSAAPATPTGPAAGAQRETAGADEAVHDRLARARSSLAAGNYRAAQAYASEVLAASPGNAAALEVQQRSADALGRFDRAIALARGRLAAGDIQGAARALAEARDIDPASPVAVELGGDVARRSRTAAGRAAEPTPAATAAIQAVSQPTPTAAPVPPASAPPASAPSIAAHPAPAPPVPPSDATSADSSAAPPTVAPERPPSAAPAAADRTGAARSAVPPPVDDGAAVRGVVAAYARAIENKDLALFRSVKPNLSREEERRLEEGFRAVPSQRVQITPTAVTIRDQEASIVVQRRDVIDAGGRRQTVDSRQTFSLARTASGWVITDIR